MPDYPCVGDTFPTREELHATIRAAGKSRGYLIKQSITSPKRVTWYCSGKYNGAKCMAGFKGAQGTEDDPTEWIVTEATEHSEACTQSRQRVVSRKSSFAEDTAVSKAVKAALRAKVAAAPPSPPPVKKVSSQDTPNPNRPVTRRTPSANPHTIRQASSSPTPSSCSTSTEPRSPPVPSGSKKSLPFTVTPPAFVINSPVSPAFASTLAALEPASRPRRRRLSSTSSSTYSQSAERKRERSRSHSTGSWYSHTSEPGLVLDSDHPLLGSDKRRKHQHQSQLESQYDDEGTIVHTILDPSFHFPTPPQQVFLGLPGEEAQAVSMCRRKRSWSGSKYGLP